MIALRTCVAMLLATVIYRTAEAEPLNFLNQNRPILDAHNCYPYEGSWSDRVPRALNSGFPVSIEQDVAWYVDPKTGQGRVVVSHSPNPTGNEPTLRDYFFEQVRPVVAKALAENDRGHWPLIILHFDFKDDTRPEVLKGVWKLLEEYQPWLSTAVKTADPHHLSTIDRKPIMVVTEDSDVQAKAFYDDVPVGGRLRLFGSAHTKDLSSGATSAERTHWSATVGPNQLMLGRATNYRRWWNGTWWEVEEGGQTNAGAWTKRDDDRLRSLVNYAHKQGYWIRFYTLDGFDEADNKGWFAGYNFGSLDRVVVRWKAAIAAGVNFIATDQYEALSNYLNQDERRLRPKLQDDRKSL